MTTGNFSRTSVKGTCPSTIKDRVATHDHLEIGEFRERSGEIFLIKDDKGKSGKFMKNCQSKGKVLFCKYLRKYRHCTFYLHILSKDTGYQYM